MTEVGVILSALLPVLLIGVFLMELLLRNAPRRGKRPDNLVTARETGVFLTVTVRDDARFADGAELRGSPRHIVSRLLHSGWGTHPLYLSPRDAESLLRCWEEEGRVLVRSEWG